MCRNGAPSRRTGPTTPLQVCLPTGFASLGFVSLPAPWLQTAWPHGFRRPRSPEGRVPKPRSAFRIAGMNVQVRNRAAGVFHSLQELEREVLPDDRVLVQASIAGGANLPWQCFYSCRFRKGRAGSDQPWIQRPGVLVSLTGGRAQQGNCLLYTSDAADE